ncbi:MAG: tail protein X [Aeromonas sp.]
MSGVTMIYTTKQGEMLDQLAHQYYEGDARGLRLLLDANPGIASHGPNLPHGIDLVMPPLPDDNQKTIISLWD